MRYRYIPITKAVVQNTENTNCWRGCGATVGVQHGATTLEDNSAVYYKPKHILSV